MIPEMNDPMGKYWDQPKDIQSAPMDEKTVLLNEHQMKQLCDYSASYPSGVYPGKCWKRQEISGWFLVWYGEDVNGKCSINYREIEVVK